MNTMIEFLSQVGAVDTTIAREKIQRIWWTKTKDLEGTNVHSTSLYGAP